MTDLGDFFLKLGARTEAAGTRTKVPNFLVEGVYGPLAHSNLLLA